jgi:hypothetical protein
MYTHTGFDVVASSAVTGDRSKHGSTAAELSHIELLEGFFPALAKAVKADSERRERALQKRRAARDRHEHEVCCVLLLPFFVNFVLLQCCMLAECDAGSICSSVCSVEISATVCFVNAFESVL